VFYFILNYPAKLFLFYVGQQRHWNHWSSTITDGSSETTAWTAWGIHFPWKWIYVWIWLVALTLEPQKNRFRDLIWQLITRVLLLYDENRLSWFSSIFCLKNQIIVMKALLVKKGARIWKWRDSFHVDRVREIFH
jgi:hypothetical protein